MRRVMKTMVVLLVVSACAGEDVSDTTVSSSSSPTEVVSTTVEPSPSTTQEVVVPEGPPPCPVVGEVFTQEMFDNGCVDGDVVSVYAGWDCVDGRVLVSSDEWFAFVGEEVQEGDDASQAYSDAYNECQN